MRRDTTAAAALLLARSATTATIPAAIDIQPSGTWYGVDGMWSAFPVSVGTPPQNVSVLISTALTSTWVMNNPIACNGLNFPTSCPAVRGGLFQSNLSTTYAGNATTYRLQDSQNMDFPSIYAAIDVGTYGYDTVGIGAANGGPTLPNQIVTDTIEADFSIIGQFGLNPGVTNISTNVGGSYSVFPGQSFLTTLYNQSRIPSLSYGYSAGAKYRSSSPGTLVLGGYNDALFQPNNLTFAMNADPLKELSVGLQSINSVVGTTTTNMLPNPIFANIDSTNTEIYLPIEACDVFENAFGLTYKDDIELYILNSSAHSTLLQQNPTLVFSLGVGTQGGQTVDIAFPYSAFDLNVSYPITMNDGNSLFYFPLKRATDSSQYTIGRVFLQEAYLTADYGRRNFSVSQRTWTPPNPTAHIVDIFPPSADSTSPQAPGSSSPSSSGGSGGSSGISGGAIAGIVIGVLAAIAIIAVALFFLRRRKQKKEAQKSESLAATEAALAERERKNRIESPPPPTYPGEGPIAMSPNTSELESPHQKPGMHRYGGYFDGPEPVEGSGITHQREETASMAEMHAPTPHELDAPHGVNELSGPSGQQRTEGEGSSRWASATVTSPVSPELEDSSTFASTHE